MLDRIFKCFQMSYQCVFPIFVIILLKTSGCLGHREEECIEVGFARASYVTVEAGYQAAREHLLPAWAQEDKLKKPLFKNLNPSLKNVTRTAQILEETSKNILATIRKTRVGKRCPEEWLLKGIEKHVTPLMQLDKEFADELGLAMTFRCLVGSPYPNVDGTCIHDDSPDMGSIGSKFLRLLPPVAGKGGFSLRTSVNAEKSLPSARSVAELIRRHLKAPLVTALFKEFGHFMARDTFSIPDSPWTEGVDCCQNPDSTDCAPILVQESDPLFATTKCIDYKRSTPAQAILGHRESFSMVSTYLDATPVYGPTNEAAFDRKTGYFGYLKAPEIEDTTEKSKKKSRTKCEFPASLKGCFKVEEDSKHGEDLELLFSLEHNRIADELTEMNPHFDDSILYNEARRITIAIYNNILYGEYLPILLGNETLEKHSLKPGSEGPGVRYIPEVNPGILTSFALASVWNPAMSTEWKSELGKTKIFDSLHYESISKGSYQDLLAVDVQKGRDHGLPGLDSWNRFCDTGENFDSWDNVENIFSKEVAQDFKELYQDEIRDIDLIAALLERPKDGAVVGKIFICILADQFARLKTGNKFYWEHETAMMTQEQRDAVRSSSAASLLCHHLKIEALPSNPFLPPSQSNPEVPCKDLTIVYLSPWEDIGPKLVKEKEGEEASEEASSEDKVKEGETTPETNPKRPAIKTHPDDKSPPNVHIEF